jgi:hypothetical protein
MDFGGGWIKVEMILGRWWMGRVVNNKLWIDNKFNDTSMQIKMNSNQGQAGLDISRKKKYSQVMKYHFIQDVFEVEAFLLTCDSMRCSKEF